MKKTKVVLAMVCAVLLVAASVMGTLAYLTSTATVTNTFTVGKVTFGDSEQQAGLDEAKVNADGVPLDKDNKEQSKNDKGEYDLNANRVTSNEYKLKPAHTYTKDPTIHVGNDSEDCYLFVKVANGIASVEAKSDEDYTDIKTQMGNHGWKELNAEKYPDIWFYCGTGDTPVAVKAGHNQIVFDEFKVSETATNDQIASAAKNNITITAYGVQSEGFESSTAEQIWIAAGFEASPSTDDANAGGVEGSSTEG